MEAFYYGSASFLHTSSTGFLPLRVLNRIKVIRAHFSSALSRFPLNPARYSLYFFQLFHSPFPVNSPPASRPTTTLREIQQSATHFESKKMAPRIVFDDGKESV